MIAAFSVAAAVLYAVSMLVLCLFGLNQLVLVAWRLRQSDPPVALPRPDGEFPRVTVQIPLFNEAHVAGRLLNAIGGLDWPADSLEVQVLDDSTDDTPDVVERHLPALRDRGISVRHIRRENREGFKAGALQAGLKQATGTFIAMFDADFVPPSDFLTRTIPVLADDDVGLVQARWGHLNPDDSILTRIQTLGLDAHFAVEHAGRQARGCFINFNGTAGVWRRSCIESAGGWQSDTLTEDLDLSYRAQLAGWQFRYLEDVEAPAELPVSMNAFRAQQHRWTKGGLETAIKLTGKLLRSNFPRHVRWEGVLHLSASSVYPFLLAAVVLHAPLVLLESAGLGPGTGYFLVMSLGLIGFAGFFLAQLVAQRALYKDWRRRMWMFPVFLAGGVGMSVANTRAAWQALRGHRTAFVRTPKFSLGDVGVSRRSGNGTVDDAPWWSKVYADVHLPRMLMLEAAMAVWSLAGLIGIVAAGQWAAIPFQAVFAGGFLLVTIINVQQFQLSRIAR